MSKVKSDIEIARAAKMKPIKEILDGINVPAIRQLSLVKFIYTLRHAKNPDSYITIHVYTTMEAPSSNDEKHHRAYSLQCIKYLRKRYLEGIPLPCGGAIKTNSSQTD